MELQSQNRYLKELKFKYLYSRKLVHCYDLIQEIYFPTVDDFESFVCNYIDKKVTENKQRIYRELVEFENKRFERIQESKRKASKNSNTVINFSDDIVNESYYNCLYVSDYVTTLNLNIDKYINKELNILNLDYLILKTNNLNDIPDNVHTSKYIKIVKSELSRSPITVKLVDLVEFANKRKLDINDIITSVIIETYLYGDFNIDLILFYNKYSEPGNYEYFIKKDFNNVLFIKSKTALNQIAMSAINKTLTRSDCIKNDTYYEVKRFLDIKYTDYLRFEPNSKLSYYINNLVGNLLNIKNPMDDYNNFIRLLPIGTLKVNGIKLYFSIKYSSIPKVVKLLKYENYPTMKNYEENIISYQDYFINDNVKDYKIIKVKK
jgi:hypothetical protein